MLTPSRKHKPIESVAMIGNYLPRKCGIATFTTDLVEALIEGDSGINCWVTAMNDRYQGYAYPDRVRFEIMQHTLNDYKTASQFININQPDIVCIQHEYGIFGGPAGSHLLKLLGNLRMPVVTSLHTVLKDPEPEYREVMLKLSELSDKLIVMSDMAIDLLLDIYKVPEDKIAYIHHGIPDTPFIDTCFNKDKFGLEGRKVLLTFGLLSPNKGIEYVLNALPSVIRKHPDVTYIILGATHPHVLKSQGDEYLIKLQQLVRELDLGKHVLFQNRFVELNELCDFLGMSDIYITPYLVEAQITSGTLIYAMGTGNAVISTPYWYASEMLAENRGRLVPFKNSDAIADHIIDLLDNETERHAIRKNAYTFTRAAIWKEVAKKYLDIFKDVRQNRISNPRPHYSDSEKHGPINDFKFPEIKLDHISAMTDDTGILQHAKYTIPNRSHGYCTDDNARALLVTVMGKKYLPAKNMDFRALCGKYLAFLLSAYNEKTGRFRNFLTYDRKWTEKKGSEDSHGRAIWSLGKAVAFLETPGYLATSTTLFNKSVAAVETFTAPRAIAFTLVGIHAYLQKFSGDSFVRKIGDILSKRLLSQFRDNMADDWPWPENKLSYANGKIPHALLLWGNVSGRDDFIETGLTALKWLISIQTGEGHFVPIGSNGWYEKDGEKARFDQQPIEANAMIEACSEAFNLTRDVFWLENAILCFNWFLGQNDLNMPVYDPNTGGCRDGLMADGINQNEGAESSLAWFLSVITLQKVYTDEILTQTLHAAAE